MTNGQIVENNEMEFGKLVQLFEQTQEKMQRVLSDLFKDSTGTAC